MYVVERISDKRRLRELSQDWEQLEHRCVFQRREWLWNWWDAYENRKDLFVLRVHDLQGRTVGILPCFRESSMTAAREIHFLGSGKACTEFQTLLGTSCEATAVAVASWLVERCDDPNDGWDLLEFDAVPRGDEFLNRLATTLETRGVKVWSRLSQPTWENELPSSWEAWLTGLEKKVRQRIRRLYRRYVETGRAELVIAGELVSFDDMFDSLVDLHQRRWQSVGVEGCFSSPEFTQFFRAAAKDLYDAGCTWMTALRIDGQIAAVAIFLRHERTLCMYQCGMDPAHHEFQPGWLLNSLNIREMIRQEFKVCDYLRGDEPYKKKLGAIPVEQTTWHFAAPRAVARMRHNLLTTQGWMRDWGRNVLGSLREQR